MDEQLPTWEVYWIVRIVPMSLILFVIFFFIHSVACIVITSGINCFNVTGQSVLPINHVTSLYVKKSLTNLLVEKHKTWMQNIFA